MFECCTTRDCCGSEKKEKKKIKHNPGALMRCAYVKCSNTILSNRLTEWKAAILGSKMYRFCCDDCWNSWLNYTKCKNANQTSITAFYIEAPSSPATPAIGPYTIIDDIPLLNI